MSGNTYSVTLVSDLRVLPLSSAEAQNLRGFLYSENLLQSECRHKLKQVVGHAMDLSAFAPAITLPSGTPITQTSVQERGVIAILVHQILL